MDHHTFRRLAEKCFGRDYRREIARHYRLTPRAVGFWDTGEVNVRWDVESDLKEWTDPERGRRKMLVARALREIDPESTESDLERFNALGDLWRAIPKLRGDIHRRLDAQGKIAAEEAYAEAGRDADVFEREAAWLTAQGL